MADNDEIESATPIDALPFRDSILTSDATTADDDPETGCGLGTNSASVWYEIEAPGDITIVIDTDGSEYDTVVVVFTEDLEEIDCNDDAELEETGPSLLEVDLDEGETYLIQVTAYDNSAAGQLELTVEEVE
ncbi:MAG: hypothetical protein GEU28_06615 [Dehalococcoidia bacterium]|nr:hypothetical protein [Dehalococcoidia bacterium]